MNQPEPLETLPDVPARRRRWRLWIGLPLLVFLLGAVSLYGLFVFRSDRAVRLAMEEIARLDPNWQVEEIEAQREDVPDEENAALVATKVKQLLPGNWPVAIPPPAPEGQDEPDNLGRFGLPLTWEERFWEVPSEVQLDAALLRDLRASLERAGAARAEAHKMIGLTRGRFPLDWQDNVLTMIVNSHDARAPANLLRYEAALRSQDGDADGALADVRGILAAARSVGDDPLLISLLIRVACNAAAVAVLERALAQGEPSARELEAVQALLEKEAAEPLLVRASRGERAGLHKLVGAMSRREVSLSAAVGGVPSSLERRLADAAGPTLARRSHAPMLRILTEYVEASKLPPEEQKAPFQVLDRKVKQAKVDYDVVTALLIPAMFKGAEAYQRGVGDLRCAVAAVALERYRHDHGRWPDALDVLAPKYLSEVPRDAGDGKALRLKRLADGVLVYWTGPDGKDDGGALNRRNYNAKNTDRGFRLWDVGHRRRPAAEVLPPPAETP